MELVGKEPLEIPPSQASGSTGMHFPQTSRSKTKSEFYICPH